MKLMVVGASGYLGNTIYKKLKVNSSNDILGTCYKSGDQELLQVNILNILDIKKILSLKPDVIIWSIMDQEKEMLLSQIGLKEIVNSISENTRLIYVSTTVGVGKNQTEDVVPHRRMPDEYLSQYVNGKIEGESIVQKHPNHVIVRPGSIYGYDCNGSMDSRMKGLFDISQTGNKYSRSANMYASFVNVQELAEAIIELTYGEYNGIINISGEKPASHYDFNRHLAKLMNIDDSFIISDYKQEAIYHNLDNSRRKHILSTIIHDI